MAAIEVSDRVLQRAGRRTARSRCGPGCLAPGHGGPQRNDSRAGHRDHRSTRAGGDRRRTTRRRRGEQPRNGRSSQTSRANRKVAPATRARRRAPELPVRDVEDQERLEMSDGRPADLLTVRESEAPTMRSRKSGAYQSSSSILMAQRATRLRKPRFELRADRGSRRHPNEVTRHEAATASTGNRMGITVVHDDQLAVGVGLLPVAGEATGSNRGRHASSAPPRRTAMSRICLCEPPAARAFENSGRPSPPART